jgi:hypothetical protein
MQTGMFKKKKMVKRKKMQQRGNSSRIKREDVKPTEPDEMQKGAEDERKKER